MNNTQIAKLLDKYFAGETSLQEEKQLKDYFSYSDIHPDFEEYAPLFRFFNDAEGVQLSDNFDDKLMERLQSENNLPKSVKTKKKEAKVFRLNLKNISRIAAAVVFVLAAFYFYEKPEPVTQPIADSDESIDWTKYEVKTQEEAYEVTLMALKKTSFGINVGAGTMAEEMSKSRVRWKEIMK
ncbi:MAG: hypothetical protein DWQ02_25645 [Bacteroidetes bacterium]|nr:MAG: hypothetical protein DWQ02_25645 [Bacteroidota bacterium]